MSTEIIYGKDQTQRVVSVEPGTGSHCTLFIQNEDGTVTHKEVLQAWWILYKQKHNDKMRELEGNQPFKYIMEYDNKAKHAEILKASRDKRLDHYVCRDDKEAFLVKSGVTYFKGLKVKNVSVLSFDIETITLGHNAGSKVILISNTFRNHEGDITRELFAYDDYLDQSDLIEAWCAWVRKMDPTVLVGHNIYGFDLPYLAYCNSGRLPLGRDGSGSTFAHRSSQFRKDGSQTYEYTNVHIYGREIVDTFFLALKYDIGRNYESYGLKQIIKQEGLERQGRTFYDASKIKDNYQNPEEWAKIKEYCKDDADDALALYDLMIAPFFYSAQSIPRSFQHVINSATGGQVNGIMVRSYMQAGHSVAEGDSSTEYEGAISFGNPGIHKNVFKIDVRSLYPSIMLHFKVYHPVKDPKKHFIQMVEFFTKARIEYKKKGQETGDRYFKDLDSSAKLFINSAYGFLGMPKANYNYPAGAAEVTRHGREILKKAIMWASGREYDPERVHVVSDEPREADQDA
jgi:DNA polymerase elongation subunit (family B)